MEGTSEEAVGRLLGRLLIPAGILIISVVLARRRKRAGKRRWWLPIPVGLLLVLLVLIGLASQAGYLSPTRELDPHSVLVPVGDHRFVASPGLERRIEANLRSDPALREDLRDVVARSITSGSGASVGTVMVVALDPFVAGRPGQAEGFARGLARGAATSTPGRIAGQEVSFVAGRGAAGAVNVVVWRHENLFIAVSASDRQTASEIASGLIRT